MEDRVIELLKKLKMHKSLSFEQIAKKLNINDKVNLRKLRKILEKYENDNEIFRTEANTYKHMSKTSFRRGVFHANKSGGGKVLVVTSYEKDGEQHVKQKEFIIKPEDANGAINNDEVLIDINLHNSEDKSAKVYKIVHRDLSHIYGKVETVGSSTYVVPIDKNLKNLMIFVEGDYLEGQIVEVKLEQQTSNNSYIGSVVKAGDFRDDPKEDILIEAFMHGVDDKFSDASMNQTDKLPDKVLPIDYIGRQDLRDEEIVTIDGKTTNDIDDAVGCKILPNGNYELTVSIADVTHYVPFNSPLDLDARRKGTSNYLAGTVIPMFPRKLSNGICSLNPNVERCAMTIRMEIDKNGNIIRKDLFPSIIKSNIKMDYDTVNNILYHRYNGENKMPADYKPHEEMLKRMYKLSLILRKKRIKNGAVEFNRPELKIVLDENGVPIKVEKRVQDIAENLIEEFMIAANVSVFSLLAKSGIPCDYRVHGSPNEERLIVFFRLMEKLGIEYKNYSPKECLKDPKALQDLVRFVNVECDPNLREMLSSNLIKCMSRAKYSVDNIGHSGLCEPIYGHFTSPIRRYPDFTIHRIIKECYFDKKNAKKNIKKWRSLLPEICYHSSKMEVNADNLERDVERMKYAEYVSQRKSEEYNGTITEIYNGTIVIQLDNLIEGIVKSSDLNGDYKYNEETFSMLSMSGQDDYFVGDKVRVIVKEADKDKRIINFKIKEKIKDNLNKEIREENNLARVKIREKEIARQERKEKYMRRK